MLYRLKNKIRDWIKQWNCRRYGHNWKADTWNVVRWQVLGEEYSHHTSKTVRGKWCLRCGIEEVER